MHAESLPDVFVPYEGVSRTAEFVEHWIEGEDSTIIVAEVAGKLVGLATVRAQTSPLLRMLARRRFTVLDSLVVAAAYRRRGIGTSLALEAHEWALSNGIALAWLNVREFNDGAVMLYESQGCKTIGRRMQVELE